MTIFKIIKIINSNFGPDGHKPNKKLYQQIMCEIFSYWNQESELLADQSREVKDQFNKYMNIIYETNHTNN